MYNKRYNSENASKIDYLTYSSFSNGSASGSTANPTGLNSSCQFSFLDLSGQSLRFRRFNNHVANDVGPCVTDDLTNIGQYNSGYFSGVLITPQHLLLTYHTWAGGFWNQLVNLGRTPAGAVNTLKFFNSDGAGITAGVINPGASGMVNLSKDTSILKLTSPITDPKIKIYNKILDMSPSSLPNNTISFCDGSNGTLNPSYKVSGSFKSLTDRYNNVAIVFDGDSGSPVFVYSNSEGTILSGLVTATAEFPGLGNQIRGLSTVIDDYLESDGGGYTIEWVTPKDLYAIKDITLSTDKTYTPDRYMIGKSIKCEVTAIKGKQRSSKTGQVFIGVSGGSGPRGHTGASATFCTSEVGYNYFYANSFLNFKPNTANFQWTCSNIGPSNTQFTKIKYSKGGSADAGISGAISANNKAVDGGNIICSTYKIPNDIPDIIGATAYYSVWWENALGFSGNSGAFYEIGGPILAEGIGLTFDYITTSAGPSAGTSFDVELKGFTAIPDLNINVVLSTIIRSDGGGSIVNNFTFSGSSFGIDIPSTVPSGSTLNLSGVMYNIYGDGVSPTLFGLSLENAYCIDC